MLTKRFDTILMYYKKLKVNILSDLTYKLIANALQVLVKNLLLLPALSIFFDANKYGLIITVVTVIALIASCFGNSLTSTRLILDEDYCIAGLQGDFNLICLVLSFLGTLTVFLIHLFFPDLSVFDLIVIAVILFLETFCAYHSGWFIIKQEYKKLLFYSISGSLGFCIGLFVTYLTRLWCLTYFLGDLCYFLFLIFYSPLVKENYTFTLKINQTITKYLMLLSSSFITNFLTYLDRFMLFPILGGEAVAIYTTAGVFGKAYSLLAIPVSIILLGYFAVGKIKLDLKKFWIINLFTFFLLAIFLVVTILFGKWATGLFYPSLIVSATPYVLIANMASAIFASTQIMKSVALKYVKTSKILLIQVLYAIAYGGLGYFWTKSFGLNGFAYAALVTSILQMCMYYFVCHFALLKK